MISYKRKPTYFCELQQRYSTTKLIFIAVDWTSVTIIRRFHSVCLLCEQESEHYDLDFCARREVWVLYTGKERAGAAMQLGHAVQRIGANKVFILRLNTQFLRG